jgi:chemotaxis response regulator CheB
MIFRTTIIDYTAALRKIHHNLADVLFQVDEKAVVKTALAVKSYGAKVITRRPCLGACYHIEEGIIAAKNKFGRTPMPKKIIIIGASMGGLAAGTIQVLLRWSMGHHDGFPIPKCKFRQDGYSPHR